ncbi:MAG: radical SAM protein [Verrucomicrobia bacterium]|nr:radical SAM protein [Verrucomicrobiota bacterium]
MNSQLFSLLRIVLNPRITATPLRVLRAMRARGNPRLPGVVEQELGGGMDKRHALGFLRQWLDGERLTRHGGQWVLNSFLPPFPGPAFNRMFENLLSGRRLSPVSAYLAVTASCPYRCWHCSLKERRTGHLDTGEWRAVIGELHGIGASLIGFTGGEPLTREELPELVAAASGGGAATIVFSSGAVVDAGQVEALRRAGLWSMCVSLDHTDPAEHDRLRGAEGAFDRALALVRLARRAGLYTMIGAVATRRLVEERGYEGLHRLGRELGAHELRLVEPMPCGRLAGAGADTLLTADHVRRLRRFHVETNRAGRRPKVCAFNQVESPELFGCGAGTQHLFIDSAGAVCPCDFTPMSFGRAAAEPLAAIWTRMSEAMGRPRRHCFIQRHHERIRRHAEGGFPLEPAASLRVCDEVGREPLPDYIARVHGGWGQDA